jgi:hypothetical protein
LKLPIEEIQILDRYNHVVRVHKIIGGGSQGSGFRVRGKTPEVISREDAKYAKGRDAVWSAAA